MTNQSITQTDLKNLLDSTGGCVFSVTFIKKDGTERVMQCRTGVTKHLKGGESNIAHVPTLYGVYDMVKEGYRCFDLTRVIKVVYKAVEYTVQAS